MEREPRPDILNAWESEWNKNAPIGQKSVEKDLFYNLFRYTYDEAVRKKDFNRERNFTCKLGFVIVIAGWIFCCFLYFMCKVLSGCYMGDTLKELISTGVFLILLMLICGAISKWVDVKKYQETWSRHSRHIHLLEKEMLLFIYQLKPYDTFRREETFVLRVMEIWDGNQNRFCENMENKEKELMDVFDRVIKMKKNE